jgi:hypothetical protein
MPGTLLADWRHLGVMPRSGRALVIGGVYPDLRSMFEVSEVASWHEIPDSSETFQLIIACRRLESQESAASMGRVLDPADGVVVIVAPPRGADRSRYRPIALQARSIRRLLRGTGLEVHTVFGALPDPWVPEYVFPLTPAAASFAIERFVMSRRPTWGWLRATVNVGLLARFATSGLPGGLILCRLRGDGL